MEVHHDARVEQREDRLAGEEPLEIRVSFRGAPAVRAWTTMRTPGHDFELAAGWMRNEALVPDEGIRRVAYCTDEDLDPDQQFNVVTVSVDSSGAMPRQLPSLTTGAAACGVCGRDSIDTVLANRATRPWAGPDLTFEVIRHLPGRLDAAQPVFSRTGGVHAAASIGPDGELTTVREDVGRHNAVDKVVGARLLAGASVPAPGLLVSGRAGFELVQKAVVSGMGALVAVGAPSALAVDLAREAGLHLWGFTSADRTVQYA